MASYLAYCFIGFLLKLKNNSISSPCQWVYLWSFVLAVLHGPTICLLDSLAINNLGSQEIFEIFKISQIYTTTGSILQCPISLNLTQTSFLKILIILANLIDKKKYLNVIFNSLII